MFDRELCTFILSEVYGNLPALFPPELLSVRLAWEGRGSDAVALFIATFVDCESELNHVRGSLSCIAFEWFPISIEC
jgi:hypothetical protein